MEEKPKKKKKIARWILGQLLIFTLILIAVHVVFSSMAFNQLIALQSAEYLESSASYYRGYVPADEVMQEHSEWIDDLGDYVEANDDRILPFLTSVFVVLPDGNGGFVYGASTTLDTLDEPKPFMAPVEELTPDVTAALNESHGKKIIHADRWQDRIDVPRPNLVFLPINDENGERKAFLCFKSIYAQQEYISLLWTFLFAGFVFILELFFSLLFSNFSYGRMRRRIIQPLKKVEAAAGEFVETSRTEPDPEKWVFRKPEFKEYDEIASLADSVSYMAEDMGKYMGKVLEEAREDERMAAEMDLASRIQRSQLYSTFPAFPERSDFDIYARMRPAKEVGGDFYDFFLIDDDHLGMVISDVSGKGIPGCMYMMVTKVLIHNTAMLQCTPAEALMRVNDQICENNTEQMFITTWFGILELSTGQILAANAGHEYPMLHGEDGRFQMVKRKHGLVMGARPGTQYENYMLQLPPGGTLFVYTDGAPEATNTAEELFGTDRMLEALNEMPDACPEELLKHMEMRIDEFVGDAPPFDDLTMMAVKLQKTDKTADA